VPSERFIEKALREKIANEGEGLIKLLTFDKKDGQRQEAFGVVAYEVKYAAKIEFKDECYWGPMWGGKWAGTFYAQKAEPGSLGPPLEHKRKGDTVTVTSDITFQKSEKGWSISSD
jgi:hypothetical protein